MGKKANKKRVRRRHGQRAKPLNPSAPSLLERAEAKVRRFVAWVERPIPYAAAVVVLILLATLVRVPLIFESREVTEGHPDARTYFNQAFGMYRKERFQALPHGGSGWPLTLAGAYSALDIGPGKLLPRVVWINWEYQSETIPEVGLPPDVLHAIKVGYAFSAFISVGIVVATLLLARQILPRAATLGALAFVAFDPFLLSQSASLMAEAGYTVLFVLAVASVVKARDHPGWLIATGALMAAAHMYRVNGLVMFVAVLAFAVLYVPKVSPRFRWGWLAACALTFALVSAPYLAWRADQLPGAFDYGTNQRFWADDLWDFSDNYWTHYNRTTGGPRETMQDYVANHTWGDAARRLYHSVAWQVQDFFVGALVPAGGAGTTALPPVLVVLMLAGLWHGSRRRELWFLHIGILFTFLTFVWIYPVVRSVRYYSPLTPLVAIVAVVGLWALASRTRWPMLASLGAFALFVGLHVISPLVAVPRGLDLLLEQRDMIKLGSGMTALWTTLALTGPAMRVIHGWPKEREKRKAPP